jgi:hypothetical protein
MSFVIELATIVTLAVLCVLVYNSFSNERER